MDSGKRGLDMERADHAFLALRLVAQWIVPNQVRFAGVSTKPYGKRILGGASLTNFDDTDIGKPEDALELEPRLFFVEVPEAFSQAVHVARANPAESQLDCRELAAVVDVDLYRGQDEGHSDAKEHNAKQ